MADRRHGCRHSAGDRRRSGLQQWRAGGAGRLSGAVYLSGYGPTGLDLYRSDGTAVGTTTLRSFAKLLLTASAFHSRPRLIAELLPGTSGAEATGFVSAGTAVLFSANDGVNGRELWSLPLALLGESLAEAFGHGCPGTGGSTTAIGAIGLPALGNRSFAITVAAARPQSAAWLMVGLGKTAVALPGGCQLLTTPLLAVARRPIRRARAS